MFKKLAFVTAAVAATAANSFAAIDPTTESAIKAGITSADASFYAIGGSVLIVLAGIWGFKQVRSLLQGR